MNEKDSFNTDVDEKTFRDALTKEINDDYFASLTEEEKEDFIEKKNEFKQFLSMIDYGLEKEKACYRANVLFIRYSAYIDAGFDKNQALKLIVEIYQP